MIALEERFVWSVLSLAQPAVKQKALFPEYVNVADELALVWEEVLEDLDKNQLSQEQLDAVSELDEYMLSISGKTNAHVWTTEALETAIEWEKLRRLARKLAKLLGIDGRPIGPEPGAHYVGE